MFLLLISDWRYLWLLGRTVTVCNIFHGHNYAREESQCNISLAEQRGLKLLLWYMCLITRIPLWAILSTIFANVHHFPPYKVFVFL